MDILDVEGEMLIEVDEVLILEELKVEEEVSEIGGNIIENFFGLEEFEEVLVFF